LILFSSFLERMTYLSTMTSLTTFMGRELGFDAVFSQQMQAISASLINFLPIVGGIIADQWSGRYWIALVCTGIATLGMGLMALGCGLKIDTLFLVALFSMYAIPVSTIRPTCIVLGADQFNDTKPEQLKQRSKFFGANYWVTNIAATISMLLIGQIALEGMGAVSKEDGFTFAYILSTGFLLGSFCCLIGGIKCLFSQDPAGSLLIRFFKVTGAAIKVRPKCSGLAINIAMLILFFSCILSIVTYFITDDVLNYIVAVLIIACCIVLIIFGRNVEWLEGIRHETGEGGRFTDEELDGVKDIYLLTPFVAYAIPFWAVYNQMFTAFITQGCQMNNVMGGTTLAPSVVGGYNGIVIVVFIPFMEYVVYPLSRKFCKGKFTLTPLRRIGVGFVLAALAMLAAGLIEIWRRSSPLIKVECTNDLVVQGFCTATQLGEEVNDLSSCYTYTGANASEPAPKRDLNLFIQILAYGTNGLAEIFFAVTMWEFFYAQVPAKYRSVCQAVNFLTISLGTMVGAVINSICRGWLPNNLDEGHQEYMYFINMGFSLVTFVVFLFMTRHVQYKPGTSYYVWDVIEPVHAIKDDFNDSNNHNKKSSSKSSSSSEEYYSYYYSDEHRAIVGGIKA